MLAGMLVVALAGCAGESIGPVPVDAQLAQVGQPTQNLGPVDMERAQLVQRTRDLATTVGAAGRLSIQDRATLTALARDVDNWLALNGQGSATLAGSGGLRQASRTSTGGTGGTCSGVCVPVVVMGDLICFITGYTCIGTQKRCQYDCFVNLDALPVRRA